MGSGKAALTLTGDDRQTQQLVEILRIDVKDVHRIELGGQNGLARLGSILQNLVSKVWPEGGNNVPKEDFGADELRLHHLASLRIDVRRRWIWEEPQDGSILLDERVQLLDAELRIVGNILTPGDIVALQGLLVLLQQLLEESQAALVERRQVDADCNKDCGQEQEKLLTSIRQTGIALRLCLQTQF